MEATNGSTQPPHQLLDERGSRPGPSIDVEPSEAERPEVEPLFLCGFCETPISKRSALFAMRASSHVQVFPNPLGQMKVIYTFRDAAVRAVGPPTTEYTWFHGYAWSVAYCASCGVHLGWRFESVVPSEPRSFYGLLKDGLKES